MSDEFDGIINNLNFSKEDVQRAVINDMLDDLREAYGEDDFATILKAYNDLKTQAPVTLYHSTMLPAEVLDIFINTPLIRPLVFGNRGEAPSNMSGRELKFIQRTIGQQIYTYMSHAIDSPDGVTSTVGMLRALADVLEEYTPLHDAVAGIRVNKDMLFD